MGRWLAGCLQFTKPQAERLRKQNPLMLYTGQQLGLPSLQPQGLVESFVHTWEVHGEYLLHDVLWYLTVTTQCLASANWGFLLPAL